MRIQEKVVEVRGLSFDQMVKLGYRARDLIGRTNASKVFGHRRGQVLFTSFEFEQVRDRVYDMRFHFDLSDGKFHSMLYPRDDFRSTLRLAHK